MSMRCPASVNIKGLQTEARIDVRNADLDLVADRSAPLAIYSDGGGSVEITPAPGGYQLDARREPTATSRCRTARWRRRPAARSTARTGAVRGGGPTLTHPQRARRHHRANAQRTSPSFGIHASDVRSAFDSLAGLGKLSRFREVTVLSTAPLLETSLDGLTLNRPRQGPRRL